eukprot:COSAG01_NODE_695_length_14201_cov_10.521875_18_plen_283_part_00
MSTHSRTTAKQPLTSGGGGDEDLVTPRAARAVPQLPPVPPTTTRKLNTGTGGMPAAALALAPAVRSVDDFLFCVISKGRSDNVPMIEALFSGTSVTPCWVVGAGEEQQYRSAGASVVHEGGKLCPSRNTALSLAQTAGKICVQCSDDISTCVFKQLADEWTAGDWEKPANQQDANARAKAAETFELSVVQGAQLVEAMMRRDGSKLGGVYPNCNTGFAFKCHPLDDKAFIVGDFLVIDPSSTVKFDLVCDRAHLSLHICHPPCYNRSQKAVLTRSVIRRPCA